MQSCWLADPTERPTFSKTRDVLFGELQRETKKHNNYQDYFSRLDSDLRQKQYKSIREKWLSLISKSEALTTYNNNNHITIMG